MLARAVLESMPSSRRSRGCHGAGHVTGHRTGGVGLASGTDYVIVHELAHILEPRHMRAFSASVARAVPDFADRRARLAQHGADY